MSLLTSSMGCWWICKVTFPLIYPWIISNWKCLSLACPPLALQLLPLTAAVAFICGNRNRLNDSLFKAWLKFALCCFLTFSEPAKSMGLSVPSCPWWAATCMAHQFTCCLLFWNEVKIRESFCICHVLLHLPSTYHSLSSQIIGFLLLPLGLIIQIYDSNFLKYLCVYAYVCILCCI